MKSWKHLGGALAIAACLVTSACNGGASPRVATLNGSDANSSSSGGGGGGGGDKTKFQDAMLDYARCMRDHGVDMPDPTFDNNTGTFAVIGGTAGGNGKAPDPNSQQYKDAEAACKPIMDRAQQYAPKPTPEEQAKMRDQALAFAKCMRDKGFDVPDPTFDNNGGIGVHVNGGSNASDSGPSTNSGAGAGPMNDPAFKQAADACNQQTGGGPKVGVGGPANGTAGGAK